jgi:hypothetical protein
MTIKKKRKKTIIELHQAKLRGLIGEARSAKIFQDEPEKKKDRFNNKLSKALLSARETIPASNQDDYLSWSMKMIDQLLPAKNPIKKPSYKNLTLINYPKETETRIEINWIITKLKAQRKIISFFLEKKQAIEKNFWQNEPESINSLYNDIENNIGQSVWLVESKFGTIQFFYGLEEQKSFLNEIKNKTTAGLIRFISYRISMRNEAAVTIPRYKNTINNLAKTYQDNNDLSQYLKFKLINEFPSTEKEIISVLRFNHNLSSVDLYETLILLTQYVVSSEEDHLDSLKKNLIEALFQINISDLRSDKIFMAMGHKSLDKGIKSNLENMEAIFDGHLNDSFNNSKNKIKNNFTDVMDVIISAHAYTIKNNSSSQRESNKIFHEIIVKLSSVIRKQNWATIGYNNLEKHLLNLSTFTSIRSLHGFLHSEYQYLSDKQNYFRKQISLNTQYINPYDLAFKNASGINVDLFIDSPNIHSLLNAENSKLIDTRKGIVEITEYISKFIYYLKTDEFHSAIEVLESIKNKNEYKYIKNRFAPLEIHCRLAVGDLSEAISTVANFVSDNDFPSEIISTDEIITKQTRWPELRIYSKDISLVILLDLVCKVYNTEESSNLRRTALDNFLINNNLNKPSEIANHLDKFDTTKVIYFLREICINNILEMCRCLKGSKEVQDERRNSLAILIKMDPKNTETYKEEILVISSNLRIKEGLKFIDGTRLHVDSEGIQRWASEELQESLFRYKSLVKAGVGVADKFSEVIKSIDNIKSKQELYEIPENEAEDILITMFEDLKDTFLLDNQYGLNSYLSKRVRHNSIAGYLRGAIENKKLITLKKDSSDNYNRNEYWEAKLTEYSDNERERILKTLEKFGSEFDKLTSYIKNEILHIKTNETPHGLITIETETVPLYLYITRSFLQENNYDLESWVDISCQFLWLMLEPSLANLRETLTKEYKLKFIVLFETLQSNLVNCTGRHRINHELFTAINESSAEFQVLIDRASQWFIKVQNELTKHSYTLNEIIDISIEAALVRHKGCNIKLNKIIDDSIILRADSLVVLSDILLIVIGNISEHSFCREHSELLIEAAYTPDRAFLQFKFENKISPESRNERSQAILDLIRKEINLGSYLENVAKEGSSGLKKIASTVRLDAGGSIDFGFSDKNTFYLNITLPYIGSSDAPYKKLEVESEHFTS